MKRYLLFAGQHRFPFGGWSDYSGSFDHLAAAEAAGLAMEADWFHVVDTKIKGNKIVLSESRPGGPGL